MNIYIDTFIEGTEEEMRMAMLNIEKMLETLSCPPTRQVLKATATEIREVLVIMQKNKEEH